MRTLKDVAGLYKILAQTYIVQGPWRPAYRTGNLYKTVGDYNTASRMIRIEGKDTFTLLLDYAPPGAKYGRFVHTGTGTNRNIGPRPYAELAAKDPQLVRQIKEFTDGKFKEEGKEIKKRLDTIFGAFSKV